MISHRIAVLWAAALCLSALTCVRAAAEVQRDVEYAVAGGQSLRLDLYRPESASTPVPLLIYVHGGAWRSGSKDKPPILPLLDKGFAIASVEYRLTPVAPFPANVQDIKAAIRFLRANAIKYGYDSKRFAIAGSSAGGHLAALVGVSNGNRKLEGEIKKFRGISSEVQAIVSFYGAGNLQTILSQSTPHGLRVREPALQLLLGGLPDEQPELAKLASPVAHVDAHDPPLLLIHGDQDPQMPVNQSLELLGAYEAVGAKAQLHIVHGGAHGGKEFYNEDRLKLVADFLNRHLPASR